jgi:hypothetical protein
VLHLVLLTILLLRVVVVVAYRVEVEARVDLGLQPDYLLRQELLIQ